MLKLKSEYWLKDVEPVPSSELPPSWFPSNRTGFDRLKDRMQKAFQRSTTMPEVAIENWESSVFRTASRCFDPNSPIDGNSSQLVVGRVQAGKTASFTGLIRLLGDNSYRIFIVVAGTSTNLRDQTFDRLSIELSDSDDIEVIRTGSSFDPKVESQNLVKRMRRWNSPPARNDFIRFGAKSVVYVALKSTKAHLDSLVGMLNNVRSTAEGDRLLSSTPALIIDDEADQASPNGNTSLRDQREMTAVYKRFSAMRDQLGKHSFVGYTATPYANVLMDLASAIRPEFVTMLDPGHDYTSAVDLFLSDIDFARTINDFEESDNLPESLKKAFALFVCQSIIFHCRDEVLRAEFFLEPFLTNRPGGTVTMLIHASRLVKVSKSVTQLLRDLRDNWAIMFQSGKLAPRRTDLAEEHIWQTYFEPALDDLESSLDSRLSRSVFKDAVREMLLEIEVLEIVGDGDDFPSDNPRDGKPIWRSRMAWVLVGGQLLDRGQTLPNLVNSYIPRSPGGGARPGEVGGQFDTLQQRGRFYGHRRTYRKILRGWFSENTLDTYRQIAVSEQQHFDLLNELDQQSIGLSDTQILFDKGKSPKLKLVRKNVLSPEVMEIKSSIWLSRQLWYSPNALENQRDLLSEFISQLMFQGPIVGRSTSAKLHNYRASAPIRAVLEMLEDWDFREGDIPAFDMARHVLTNSAQHEGLKEIDIVMMSRDQGGAHDIDSHEQYRSTSAFAQGLLPDETIRKIKQLPSSNDANYTSAQIPTLQIHFIDVKNQITGEVYIKNAIGLALSSPSVRPGVFRGALSERE